MLRGFNRQRIINVKGGIRLAYRLNRGDIWTIYEVWMLRVYRLPVEPISKTLIDLGGNIGLTSVWLAKTYGFSDVLLVEPAASNAAVARINLEANHISGTVIEAAVGAADGSAQFCETGWSTHNHLVDGGDAVPSTADRTYAVDVQKMETILRKLPSDAKIGLVKLDVEGAEQEILTGDVGWLGRVESLIVEFHPPRVDVPRLIATLRDEGFRHLPAGGPEGCAMHVFIKGAT